MDFHSPLGTGERRRLAPLAAALANAIVKLSHTLQLHTVAEGIQRPSRRGRCPR